MEREKGDAATASQSGLQAACGNETKEVKPKIKKELKYYYVHREEILAKKREEREERKREKSAERERDAAYQAKKAAEEERKRVEREGREKEKKRRKEEEKKERAAERARRRAAELGLNPCGAEYPAKPIIFNPNLK